MEDEAKACLKMAQVSAPLPDFESTSRIAVAQTVTAFTMDPDYPGQLTIRNTLSSCHPRFFSGPRRRRRPLLVYQASGAEEKVSVAVASFYEKQASIVR
jgi:hypothetical protein